MKKYLILLMSWLSLSAIAAEKQVNLYIEEMNCQLCVYLVNKELRNIEGVISTKGNFKDRLMKVVAEESLPEQQLIEAVAKLHYKAVIQP